MALGSGATGKCLFIIFSFVMAGDNSIISELRILTAIELYLYAEFYSKHPCFHSSCADHPDVFTNLQNLLAMSVSQQSLDTGKQTLELVKEESIHICQVFFVFFALATVSSRKVQCV